MIPISNPGSATVEHNVPIHDLKATSQIKQIHIFGGSLKVRGLGFWEIGVAPHFSAHRKHCQPRHVYFLGSGNLWCFLFSVSLLSSYFSLEFLTRSLASIITARCTLVQSAVLRSHVVRPSVRLSVCNVGGSGPHRLEILETNCTNN